MSLFEGLSASPFCERPIHAVRHVLTPLARHVVLGLAGIQAKVSLDEVSLAGRVWRRFLGYVCWLEKQCAFVVQFREEAKGSGHV